MVSTRITLWEKEAEAGILVGSVSREGGFHAAFSEKEIAALRSGASWLTLTVGNSLTERKSDHPKLGWESLSHDPEDLQPVIVARPRLYHGRIVFEDGAPATANAWMGRRLMVTFPHAGSARVNSDGWFQVCFTGEQFEKAKADKERRNIYIPSDAKWDEASAKFVFPASKLSHDRQKAGVVRIPRPRPLSTAESPD
jgi:hypothetical protein